MTQTSGRRFIAGAVCPRCAGLDTIYIYQLDDVAVRACVDCDFEEQAAFQQSRKELPTRVNQTVDHSAVEIKPIKIVDPSKTKE